MAMRKAMGLFVLAALATLPATASTFLAMSQEELAAGAGAVVVGKVSEVRSFWNEEHTAILTEAVVKVGEVILGEAPATVVVRTFGGTADGYTVEAHGFPTFLEKQRLLVFLHQERDGSLRVLGYQQGQYYLVRGDDGVELAVPAVETDARLVTREGRLAPMPEALPLDTLKSQIRRAARRVGRAGF